MKSLALAGATAIGLSLLFAVPATAQPYDYDYGYRDRYAYGDRETVIVTSPYYREERDPGTGAPIVPVAASREIAMDDADLQTAWGAHLMRVRVRETAQSLCRHLDMQYATINSGSRDCYERAVNDGMAQADDAIARARGARF